MSKKRKKGPLGFLGRWLKRLAILLVVIIVLANAFILITGRTYMYKGLKETYLIGRSGPSIYDSLVFDSRKIEGTGKQDNWLREDSSKQLSAKQIQSLTEVESTSFLVIQHGNVVAEHYFDDHTKKTLSNSFSGSKSVVGLLIGIAVDKGMIKSLDEPISRYLDFVAAKDSNVTIRHLLGMTSDIDWSESGSNPLSDNAEAYYGSDLLSIMKKQPFKGSPNKVFDYASGNSQLLGFILEKATGQKVSDFMSENLWKKINAETDALWSLDSEEGMEKAFCCLYSTTRDYARLGQLILNKGTWGGDTIISSAMLTEITTNYVLDGNKVNHRYGLHYWILNDPAHKVIYARGIKGQYVISIPDLDVVIVRTGHKRLDKAGEENIKSGEDYMIDHPMDLFLYLEIAKELLEQ
jgi:CubicO group peptidase (beta-lactamase class C family)